MKVCAIVVTYNRKTMLEGCVRALLGQTYENFDIFIIDNGSTDGTQKLIESYLSDRIKYFNTGSNLGGAGGFYYGLKEAYKRKYEWMWIMDDDVIPTETALNELVIALEHVNKCSFLASAVYSQNGSAMNTPEISKYSTNGYRFWYDKLEYGMVRIMHATFVSLFINAQAIAKCGLPCKDYFIWGDDTEYTMRIIGSYGAAYFVGKSKVYHLRNNSSTLNLMRENDVNRISMYYYMVRNTLLNMFTYFGTRAEKGMKEKYISDCKKILRTNDKNKWLKVNTVYRGIRDFKRGNYNEKAFLHRYDIYGQEDGIFTFMGAKNVRNEIENGVWYNVVNTFDGCSIFTAFEDMPTFYGELLKDDCSGETKNEINRVLKNFTKTYRDEFFVFDFLSSLNKIVKVSVDDKIILMNYTKETEKDFKDGKIPFMDLASEIIIEDVTEKSREEIKEAVLKFAANLTTRYRPSNLVMVKQPKSAIKGEIEQTFYYTLCEEFVKRVPQCKIIDMTKENVDISERIKEITQGSLQIG